MLEIRYDFLKKVVKIAKNHKNNKNKCSTFSLPALLCHIFYFTTLQFLLVVSAIFSVPAPGCNCAPTNKNCSCKMKNRRNWKSGWSKSGSWGRVNLVLILALWLTWTNSARWGVIEVVYGIHPCIKLFRKS